jgi:hypothetical protein
MAGKRAEPVNVGRRKVDPGALPTLSEEEAERQRQENAERTRRIEDGRLRFGPLRGDVRR